MAKDIITNSSLTLFRECPRKYEYRYEMEIVPKYADDEALNYGTLVHNALERHYKGESIDKIKAGLRSDIDSIPEAELDQREEWAAKIVATIKGYIARYQSEDDWFEVLEVEKEFSGLKVINPATDAPSRTFVNSGKLDMVVRRKKTGMLWLVEHKTTGSAIDDRYFAKCDMDTQIARYVRVVEEIYGEPVEGILYNVIGKYSTKRKAAETQEHFEERIEKAAASLKPIKQKAATKNKPAETDEEFAARNAEREEKAREKVREAGPKAEESHKDYSKRLEEKFMEPSRFGRREIILDHDLIRQCQETEWAWAQMILQCRRATFPQNPTACNNWGRTCEFHRICSNPCNAAQIIEEDFKHKAAHEELEENQNVEVSNREKQASIHTSEVDPVLPRGTGSGEIDLRV